MPGLPVLLFAPLDIMQNRSLSALLLFTAAIVLNIESVGIDFLNLGKAQNHRGRSAVSRALVNYQYLSSPQYLLLLSLE
jgi:hypothetical protein